VQSQENSELNGLLVMVVGPVDPDNGNGNGGPGRLRVTIMDRSVDQVGRVVSLERDELKRLRPLM